MCRTQINSERWCEKFACKIVLCQGLVPVKEGCMKYVPNQGMVE